MEQAWVASLSSADAEDVTAFYRIFLGRYPECEEVVSERVGHDFRRLVEEFTSSTEFHTEVVTPLLLGRPWRSDAFNMVLDRDLLRWLETRFGLEGIRLHDPTITSAWASVLLQLLNSPMVSEGFGGGQDAALSDLRDALKRLRLTHALAESDERAGGGRSLSAVDLAHVLTTARNTYLLVRGRKLTSPAHAYRALHLDPVEQVAAHLLSQDFEEKVELPLLATGQASGERFATVLRQGFKAWVIETLPLTAEGKRAMIDAADHPSLLAALLHDPEFVSALRSHVPGQAFGERLAMLCALFGQFHPRSFASGLLREEPTRQFGKGLRLVLLDQGTVLTSLKAGAGHEKLEADHNLLPLEDNKSYRVLGPDPHFLVEGSMPAGRRVISLDLRYSDVRSADLRSWQVFFYTGDGFTEQSSLRLPINNDRGAQCVFLIQESDTLRMRIDPCEDVSCTVQIEVFTVADFRSSA